jgi:hypothetical protein
MSLRKLLGEAEQEHARVRINATKHMRKRDECNKVCELQHPSLLDENFKPQKMPGWDKDSASCMPASHSISSRPTKMESLRLWGAT